MTDAEIQEIANSLKRAHRINNPIALFKLCDEAAAVLDELVSERNKPKRGRPPKALSVD